LMQSSESLKFRPSLVKYWREMEDKGVLYIHAQPIRRKPEKIPVLRYLINSAYKLRMVCVHVED
jgi:hypothetical protein